MLSKGRGIVLLFSKKKNPIQKAVNHPKCSRGPTVAFTRRSLFTEEDEEDKEQDGRAGVEMAPTGWRARPALYISRWLVSPSVLPQVTAPIKGWGFGFNLRWFPLHDVRFPVGGWNKDEGLVFGEAGRGSRRGTTCL